MLLTNNHLHLLITRSCATYGHLQCTAESLANAIVNKDLVVQHVVNSIYIYICIYTKRYII
jgi:hypothetical protein